MTEDDNKKHKTNKKSDEAIIISSLYAMKEGRKVSLHLGSREFYQPFYNFDWSTPCTLEGKLKKNAW